MSRNDLEECCWTFPMIVSSMRVSGEEVEGKIYTFVSLIQKMSRDGSDKGVSGN